MLKVVKNLSKIKNVTIGILSNCYYPEQREDKIAWLNKHTPYIDAENINIIVYSETACAKDEKNNLKANKIKTITGYDKVYLIEDTHEIIKATNKILPNTARHFSELRK